MVLPIIRFPTHSYSSSSPPLRRVAAGSFPSPTPRFSLGTFAFSYRAISNAGKAILFTDGLGHGDRIPFPFLHGGHTMEDRQRSVAVTAAAD